MTALAACRDDVKFQTFALNLAPCPGFISTISRFWGISVRFTLFFLQRFCRPKKGNSSWKYTHQVISTLASPLNNLKVHFLGASGVDVTTIVAEVIVVLYWETCIFMSQTLCTTAAEHTKIVTIPKLLNPLNILDPRETR